MPHEERREGVKESEVTIAFPLDEHLEPKLQNNMTFNFLPIRGYGLPFTLNADFMLSANREDVLQDRHWNQAIMSAAIELFVDSIHTFNAQNIVKYSWPRFLKAQGDAHGTAFQGFLKRLQVRCCTEAVLESVTSTMKAPNTVQSMWEMASNGAIPPKPLIATTGVGALSFVSTAYSLDDLTSTLGIRKQTPQDFLALLQSFVQNNHAKFIQKPANWHSRAAAAILHIGAANVRNLRIIPLRRGGWTAVSAGKVYFPDISDGVQLPQGISVNIVEDHAARDRSRSKLFTELGVGRLDSAEVYRLILSQHRSHCTSYEEWTVEHVVSHARFLFDSPNKPQYADLSVLLVASQNSGLLHHGQDLYMDNTQQGAFRMTDIFGKKHKDTQFIHEQYLSHPQEDSVASWNSWLQKVLGIRTMPRLAVSGCLSSEFKFIIDSRPAKDWLLLLKEHWLQYAGELNSGYNGEVRKSLSTAKVLCIDGKMHQVKTTYLATSSIKNEPMYRLGQPVLSLDGVDDKTWVNFHNIELKTMPDLHFYLTILKNLQASSGACTTKDVQRLYEGINRCSSGSGDISVLRNAFASKNLVFISSENNPTAGKWMSLASCRWTSPKFLRTYVPLAQFYRSLHALFVTKLGLKCVTARDIVNELEKVKGRKEHIGLIKDLLLALNTLVGREPDFDKILGTIRKAGTKILPVSGSNDQLRSTLDRDWFIPDRQRYVKCFEDSVTLLDFSSDEISSLMPLLRKLGLESRSLEAHVQEETEADGDSVFNDLLTKQLRSKAGFIARLVSPEDFKDVLQELRTIEVWCSATLKLCRYVTLNNNTRVYGKEEKGWVIFREAVTPRQIVLRLGSTAFPPQVVEKFMSVFAIENKMKDLLNSIISTHDDEAIEDLLERAKIRPAPDTTAPVQSAETSAAQAMQSDLEMPDDTEEIVAAAAETAAQPTTTLNGVENVNKRPQPARPTVTTSAAPDDSSPSSHPRGTAARRVPNGSRRNPANGNTKLVAAAGSSLDVFASKAVTPSKPRPSSNQTAFETSEMRSAIDAAAGSSRSAMPPAKSLTPSHTVASPKHDTGSEYQQGIGSDGEYLIYTMLTDRFGIGHECWTSELRSAFDLPPFTGSDSEHADFTIRDAKIVDKVANWLVEIGCPEAAEHRSANSTCHIEVKSTTGLCNEPFSMSSNQVSLARAWHESPSDFCLILRVFDLYDESPDFCVYFDPLALMEAGQLIRTPTAFSVASP